MKCAFGVASNDDEDGDVNGKPKLSVGCLTGVAVAGKGAAALGVAEVRTECQSGQ